MSKNKGSAGERELVKLFWEQGWAAIRVAGSGSSQFPSPDIMTGNGNRRLAIEAKVTKSPKKYFPKDEIKQLKVFAEYFGCEPWLAVKFFRENWYFINPEDLKNTKENFVLSLERARNVGLSLFEIIGSTCDSF